MSAFDLWVIAGFALGALGCVTLVAAFVEGRFPRLGPLYLAVAVGLFWQANRLAPEGLRLTDVPEAFIRLVAVMTR